jgi:sugar phosphate isomerase/epimerase/SAM-dependent methyltransferase
MGKAKFAYTVWQWGTDNKEQFVQALKDITEAEYEYFESVKAAINVFDHDASPFLALCKEYGVKPNGFYFHLNGKWDNDVEDVKKKLPFMAACDIHRMNVQATGVVGRPATQEELDYDLKAINAIAELAKEFDIIPCVHPHYNTTVMYESEIDFIMQNTDPELVAFGPDTAHLTAGKCDPVKVIKKYADRVKFTHLKDITAEGIEFWYIIRRENIAYYAQLLSKRTYTEKNLNKGELRPEFALLIAYWAQIKANDVVMDPFAGYGSIPLQIYKNLKFHKLIVNDIDINKVKYIKKLFAKFKEAKNVEIICKDSMCLPNIGDKTIDKIIADPPWGIYEEIGDIQDFYHNLLVEFKRVLKDEGEIIILTSGKIELENAASSCGLKIFDKIDTLVNGKKAGVFKLVKNSQIKVNN